MDVERSAFEHWCSPFYQDSPLNYLFMGVSYFFLVVPLLWIFAGFWKKQAYTLYFSLVSLLNTLVNYLLRVWIVRQRTPRGGCTRYDYGMPSIEVQQAFFVLGYLNSYLLYFNLDYPGWIGRSVMTGLSSFAVLVAFVGQIYLGANTPNQVWIGAVLGYLLAEIAQQVYVRFLYPRMRDWLSRPLAQKFRVEDQMCNWKKTPVRIVVRDPGHKPLFLDVEADPGDERRVLEGIHLARSGVGRSRSNLPDTTAPQSKRNKNPSVPDHEMFLDLPKSENVRKMRRPRVSQRKRDLFF